MAGTPGVPSAPSSYPYTVLRSFEEAGVQAAAIPNSNVDDSTLAAMKADVDAALDQLRDALVDAGIVASG